MNKETDKKPKFYLILHNIQTKKNLGTLVRSASAFNVHKIFLVAKTPESTKKIFKQFKLDFGSHGTMKKISYEVFFSIGQLQNHCVANHIRICGIEITQNSQSIDKHPFEGDTAFFLGNEGQGLIEQHKKICDFFVYIPQYTDKTASLNVAVAGSIIFHHFALWAKYEESQMFGEKFQNQEE